MWDCLVLQQLHLRWTHTDRDTASQAVFKQRSPFQRSQIWEVGWGAEGMASSSQGRAARAVGCPCGVSEVEWPKWLLSQSSSPFPVLQHGVVSSPEVVGYHFCVLAAGVASI